MLLNKKGFTLVEMMTVVAMVLIIAGIGVVNIVGQLPSRNLTKSARNLVSKLRDAKTMAIKLNRNIQINFNTNNTYSLLYPYYDATNTMRSVWNVYSLDGGISFGYPGRSTLWKFATPAGADAGNKLYFTPLGFINNSVGTSGVSGYVYLQNRKKDNRTGKNEAYRVGIRGLANIVMEKCGDADSTGAPIDCTTP